MQGATGSGSNSIPATCTEPNASYRPDGYRYVVDVGVDDVGRPLTVSGYDLGTYQRAYPKPSNGAPPTNPKNARPGAEPPPAFDCDPSLPPFNTSTYSTATKYGRELLAGFGAESCQTGDSWDANADDEGGQNLALEVFDTGPNGEPASEVTLPDCAVTTSAAAFRFNSFKFKNAWAPVCTFTPRRSGEYTVRVRNSGLDGLEDLGTGTNSYALKVTGGTTARLRPLGDFSTLINGVGPTATIPIAEIGDDGSGRTMIIDAFDPGDGAGDTQTIRVAPPSSSGGDGSAAISSCRYNATAADARGPEVPDVADACTVVTTNPQQRTVYNGTWLRIEVAIAPGYHCEGDCMWSIVYDFGSGRFPTDRVVWSVGFR
jgi:hypothetical protein